LGVEHREARDADGLGGEIAPRGAGEVVVPCFGFCCPLNLRVYC
jgi:hypothetical protein